MTRRTQHTTSRNVAKVLHLHPYKITVVHKLRDTDRETRVNFTILSLLASSDEERNPTLQWRS